MSGGQGWQFQMEQYRQRLSANAVKQSMSRKGSVASTFAPGSGVIDGSGAAGGDTAKAPAALEPCSALRDFLNLVRRRCDHSIRL